MERILGAAASAGARYASRVLLRLPHELRELFTDWLRLHRLNRVCRVLLLIHDVRGGTLNDSRFGQRFEGEGEGKGAYAALLARRFEIATRRHSSEDRHDLDCSHFAAPPAAGDQLRLL